MRIAITGASGKIGAALGAHLAAQGHGVDPLPGWRLGQPARLAGADVLIHAALAHLPGRYRGGEGADAAGFVRLNGDGTAALMRSAARAGVRVIFLSSRAVHDGHPPGPIPDDAPPRPTTLYGQIKVRGEAAMPPGATALRVTGVYGPGRLAKWGGLFADYLAGRPVTPHVATELHIDDLCAAIDHVLATPNAPRSLNVSDLVLDRADLLAGVAALTGCGHPLPARADDTGLRVLSCAGLRQMGWCPGGMARLRASLPAMLDEAALL